MTYPTAVKNARLDAVTAQIGTTGVLEICSAGYAAVLATIALGNPAAPGASGGVLTFSGFPRSDTSADATGTAAVARIRAATDGSADAQRTLNGRSANAWQRSNATTPRPWQ